jgi:hypothetical protein
MFFRSKPHGSAFTLSFTVELVLNPKITVQ